MSVPRVEKSEAHTTIDAGGPPIACPLGAGAMATRLDEWNALLADERDLLQGLTARRRFDERDGSSPNVPAPSLAVGHHAS